MSDNVVTLDPRRIECLHGPCDRAAAEIVQTLESSMQTMDDIAVAWDALVALGFKLPTVRAMIDYARPARESVA